VRGLFLLALAVSLFIPAVSASAQVARVDLVGCDSNFTFDYYETVTVKFIAMIDNPTGFLTSDWLRIDRWNTTLGAWQSYLNYNITDHPNLSWDGVTFDPGDLSLEDNTEPYAKFRAGVWSWNSSESAYEPWFLRVFYIYRPEVQWTTKQQVFRYGARVRVQFYGLNWRYWRDYYQNELWWVKCSGRYELACTLVVYSYPTMYELVPDQFFYMTNDTSSAENRDIVGTVEFTIPDPGALGTDVNVSVYAFRHTTGASLGRTLIYSENTTLISRAFMGVVADKTAEFFGLSPGFVMMLVALSGVVVVTIFVGSVMQMTGPGYAVIMLAGILIITALGWFDVWYATLAIVVIIGFLFFSSGEGYGGVAGEV